MKAIVTGASGFFGSHLVAELINDGFEVAAIGRRNLNDLSNFRKKLLKGSNYFNFDLDFPHRIKTTLKRKGFFGSDLKYFFHLAWGGDKGLSDLNIKAQNKNVIRTLSTYDIAEFLNVDRYIFCGTMEEKWAELYTNLNYKNEKKFNRHVVYALAKITARQALKLRYMDNGPDILFATNSHVMGPGDTRDSFLQVSLKKILNKENISMTSGEPIFDVINVKDCAKAYRLIAKRGKLRTSYWVGSGQPKKLKEYIKIMNSLFPSVKIKYGALSYDDVYLNKKIFNINKIKLETGFHPSYSFSDTVIQVADYFKSEKK